MSDESNGKRRFPRYHVDFPVAVYMDTGEIRSRIVQVSRGGCLVFPTLPTPESPSLKISFRLSQDLPFVNCRGELVYSIKDKGTGVAFTEISSYNQDLITNYCEKQASKE